MANIMKAGIPTPQLKTIDVANAVWDAFEKSIEEMLKANCHDEDDVADLKRDMANVRSSLNRF